MTVTDSSATTNYSSPDAINTSPNAPNDVNVTDDVAATA